jgi:hypothetical protein
MSDWNLMLTGFEIKSTVHLLGLAALGFSLLAMSMRNILILRILSAIANFIYIIYGLLLGAPPLIIGGAIVIAIHGYHIRKLLQNNKLNCENC